MINSIKFRMLAVYSTTLQLKCQESPGQCLRPASNGQGNPFPWPLHYSDFTCLDFFFLGRGHIKNLVCKNLIISKEDLVAHLSVAAGHVIHMPDTSFLLWQSMHHLCNSCITVGLFEHL